MATNEDKANDKKKKKTNRPGLGNQVNQASRGGGSLSSGENAAIFRGTARPEDAGLESRLPAQSRVPTVATAPLAPARRSLGLHDADIPSRQTSPIVPTAIGEAPPVADPDLTPSLTGTPLAGIQTSAVPGGFKTTPTGPNARGFE